MLATCEGEGVDDSFIAGHKLGLVVFDASNWSTRCPIHLLAQASKFIRRGEYNVNVDSIGQFLELMGQVVDVGNYDWPSGAVSCSACKSSFLLNLPE